MRHVLTKTSWMNEDKIEALIEANQRITTRETLATRLNLSNFIIIRSWNDIMFHCHEKKWKLLSEQPGIFFERMDGDWKILILIHRIQPAKILCWRLDQTRDDQSLYRDISIYIWRVMKSYEWRYKREREKDYLIETHRFDINLLSSVERLEMRIKVIFLDPCSACGCCPNLYRIARYRQVRQECE